MKPSNLRLRAVFIVASVFLTASLSDSRAESPDAILQKLKTITSLKSEDITLQDAAKLIGQRFDIPIRFDDQGLEAAGFNREVKVSGQFKNVSVSDILRAHLSTANLTFMIRGGELVITTIEIARRNPRLKIYDISRLLQSADDSEQLERMATAIIGAGQNTPGIYGSIVRKQLVVSATEIGHLNLSAVLQQLTSRAYASNYTKVVATSPSSSEAARIPARSGEAKTPDRNQLDADPFGLRIK